MRIDRLDLVRYGRFTQAQLPLGAPSEGRADLHIVYGDNEAGKTTTLNAMLDVVFGIEASTPYKFLHQAAAMRLGGALEIDGRRLEVIRLPKSALLDGDGGALPDGLFNQELAGLDRETYKTMFSLDEKMLAAGGESILAAKGDLGKLLFSASAGLAEFSDALARLKSEAETFYKVHGRKHDLGDLKRQLADLKERRTAIDMTAAPFARLIAAREEAQVAYDAAVKERGRLQADLAKTQRQLATLPRLAEWRRVEADLAALPTGPVVPRDWPDELGRLNNKLVVLETRRDASYEEIERLTREIEALPVDEAGLEVAASAARLSELRARDAMAAKDLPDRYTALRVAETEVAGLVKALGRADCTEPRELLLPSPLVARLRQSLEDRSGLIAAWQEAQAEVAEAEANQREAIAALAEKGSSEEDEAAFVRLESELIVSGADDAPTRLRLAEHACVAAQEALAEHMAALAPWSGEPEALARLDIPQRDERDRLARSLAEISARQANLRSEAERLDDDIRRTTAIRDGLVCDQALVDDAVAAASRAARDRAWSEHLAWLDLQSASAFETALRADDANASARLMQTSALAELRSLNRSLTCAAAERDGVLARLAVADEERQVVDGEIAAWVPGFQGETREAPLAALEAFIAKRERALEARRVLSSAQKDRRNGEADLAALHERLGAALVAAGAAMPAERSVAALTAGARAFVSRAHALRALHQRVEDCAHKTSERQRRLQRVEQDRALWDETWARALQSTWLSGAEADRVRDALAAFSELGPALVVRDGLADRIGKMESDRAAFAAEARNVAATLGICVDANPADLAELIATRTLRASEAAKQRAGRSDDRAKAQARLDDVTLEFDAAEARGQTMMKRFAAASLEDLAAVFEAAGRRSDLLSRQRELEIEICSATSAETVEEALSSLAELTRDDVERRQAELAALCEGEVLRAQECFAALGRARDAVAAIDGDAAAARLEEERRTVLLEIEQRTFAHLALRAGIIAAEGAIDAYRERHRSAMMQHASVVFSSLTRGAYSGLATQGAKDGEVLVGIVAGGGSKLSTEMSTATRNQLYLALRIAAYREFTKTRRPLPFVLDDVLETFDDDRSEASLSLLADMAKTGQVIYLTHHRHLCAIARRVCPEANLHDLGQL